MNNTAPPRHLAQLLIIIFSLLISACSNNNDSTFSAMPGFIQYFENNKPSPNPATAQEQSLLKRYRPRIYMSKDQTRFLDFYSDYIANGELYSQGKLISQTVTAELLNQYKNDPTAEFRHIPADKTSTPVIYGRIDHDELIYADKTYPLAFLSYNLPFAHSGLLKGLPGWQQWLVNTAGWNADWHQLDHYVGLTLVLYQEKPLAIMLQQHNYQTTYLIGHTGPQGIDWPADQRIKVDVAIQSNELYPHSSVVTEHRGVSFVTADNMEFMKTGNNMPMMAGYDMTYGEQEQDYTLKFLPTADAFYTFKGRLGEKRSLPGRDGPPGANYVTLPGLMPWANRLVSAFRPGSVEHEQAKISALFDEESFSINPAGLDAYRKDFVEAAFR